MTICEKRRQVARYCVEHDCEECKLRYKWNRLGDGKCLDITTAKESDLDLALFMISEKGETVFPPCCGTCKYHHHESIDDGWVCVNPESDYCTEWTEDGEQCPKWKGRD